MTESEIDEKSEDIFHILKNDTERDNNIILVDEINDEVQKGERITEKTVDKENQNKIDFLNKASSSKRTSLDNIYSQTTKPVKIRRNTSESLDNDENAVKIERIKRVMEDEKEMANVRKSHENRMIMMKENFQKELYALDIRAATAKAELAELQLQKEQEKYMRL
ncbi:hypothetical protein ALC62_13656 [Cyphomyrmex costatus]|uniref:Uncharacterized protein n=1 Tax=Cyphomyrmex costatus TaxID=456900 RepID=A0A151I9H6_9HYME|nr:hypothetical protein ALC62_13656 [Cyphomyrmex costatus]